MSEQKSFEASLQELESVVARLENGELSLDDSIRLFEEGMRLSADCRKTLETAKQTITRLTETGEENAENV
ncbi:MAG: exodeoxyribonuclease VII small subunit [Clostridia bacterium]|nr:exodeoxyribonuclease VII small subunit [Clostridia bacterium]